MTSQSWKDYVACYRDKRGRLLLTVLASVAASLLSLPLILLVRSTFDTVLPAGDIKRLMLFALAILGCSVAVGAITLWIRKITLEVTKSVIVELRQRVLERLYRLPRSFFGRHDRMKLHNNIVQDTERIDVMSNALVAQVLPSLFIGGMLLMVLFYLHWILLLAMLTVTPLFIWVNRLFRSRLKQQANRFRSSFEAFSKGALFVLQSLDLTRLKAAESVELDRQRATLEELRANSIRIAWFDTLYKLSQDVMTTVASLVILMVGGAAVGTGKMTIGELLSFYVTARILNAQTGVILGSVPPIILGMEALRDVHALLNCEEQDAYRGTRQVDFSGAMTLEGVSFSYRPGHAILQDVSLAVVPGRTVALVGANGSGKSTIVSLLCGFYRPSEGRVLAGAEPLDGADLRHLRRGFGVVPQEPLLFPGTVRDNIAYGLPNATDEEIHRAAARATASAAIAGLDDGYDTQVGEGGMLLSGGQAQRIAIARALIGQPRLLILDEPTNHLDANSIRELLENLKRLPQHPAIVLVSHDEKVIEQADIVYRLDDHGRAECQRGGSLDAPAITERVI